MSQLQSSNAARRGEQHTEPGRERPYRRAHHASEAVVARYLNDITGRTRGDRVVRRRVRDRRPALEPAAC